MIDLNSKTCIRLISDYMLYVQHNASKMIKNGRNLTQYDLTDYLVEELNYTQEEAIEIRESVKKSIKK